MYENSSVAMLSELQVPEEFLATVRTPMGVYVGARTHEEIAVSVVAELIAVRRTGTDASASWQQKQRQRPKDAVRYVADSGSG